MSLAETFVEKRARGNAPKGAGHDDWAALVVQASAGDHEAFSCLYRHTRSYAERVVTSRLTDAEACLDVLQETYASAWLHLPSLRNPAAFQAWVAQIARRACVDHQRRTARLVLTDFGDPSTSEQASTDFGPDEWAAASALARECRKQLDALSARDATLIRLASVEGCGPQEIGVAIGVSANAAKVSLHRARRRLLAQVS